MNLRPPGYEPDELPDCSIPQSFNWRLRLLLCLEAGYFQQLDLQLNTACSPAQPKLVAEGRVELPSSAYETELGPPPVYSATYIQLLIRLLYTGFLPRQTVSEKKSSSEDSALSASTMFPHGLATHLTKTSRLSWRSSICCFSSLTFIIHVFLHAWAFFLFLASHHFGQSLRPHCGSYST